MDKQELSGLQKAIQTVGDVDRFAAKLGITVKTVRGWLEEDGSEVPPTMRPQNSGIQQAVTKAGGNMALARELGVSHQSVGLWLKQGYVPLQRAQEIEHHFGVSRIDLVSAKVRNAMGAGGDL